MCIIPLMPYIDHPMEHLTEEAFHYVWPLHHEEEKESVKDKPETPKQAPASEVAVKVPFVRREVCLPS